MAANLKGGNALVRFLLTHGEKLGMAGIAVCAGMLIWSALGLERLGEERQPATLEQLVTRADSHIREFRWDSSDEENILVAAPLEGEAMKKVLRKNFPNFQEGIDRGTLDPVGLRRDPVLATAEDLEVSGDAGLWAEADPAVMKRKQLEAIAKAKRDEKAQAEAVGRRSLEDSERGGRPRGEMFGGRDGTARGAKKGKGGAIVVQSRTGAQLHGFETIKADSWITLLARVPIEKQYQLYDEALKSALGYNSTRDIPNYIGYQVQRAEIAAAGEGEWNVIDTVTMKSIQRKLDTYPVNMTDVVAPRFNHPVLTHPLPPLILREWDERVSHSSMPLASEDQNLPEIEESLEDESEEDPEEEDLFAGPATSSLRGGRGELSRGMAGGRGASMRGRGRGMGMGEGMGMGMGEGMGMGMGMGEGMGMGMGEGMRGGGRLSSRPVGASLPVFNWDNKTPDVLLRYFDTSARPGRKYRYKVRLVMIDVNNISSVQHLDPSVTDRRATVKKKMLKYRFTDWSKPSPIASVPLPARVYLAAVKPAKEANYNSEPEAELLVKALNAEYAAEIALLRYFPRGSVVNLHDKATVIWANHYEAESEPKFDFRTGVTLLDFSGGEKLSKRNKKLVEPARAVFMDPAGRLSVQSELDEVETLEDFRLAVEGGQDQRGPGRGMGYGGGEMGMGMEMGGRGR